MIGAVETWEPAVGDPVTGWRTWRAQLDDETGVWRLRSLYHKAIWPGREPLTAVCMVPAANRIPDHGCPSPPDMKVTQPPTWPVHYPTARTTVHECGIYATRTREWAESYRHAGPEEAMVIGSVSLWGRVCVHAKGYRAQYAYPTVLIVAKAPDGHDRDDVAEALHDLYGADTATL